MGKDSSCFDLICLRCDFTMEPGLESQGCLVQTQIHDPSLYFPCFYITDLSMYVFTYICVWASKGSCGSVLSFHNVGFGNGTQVIRRISFTCQTISLVLQILFKNPHPRARQMWLFKMEHASEWHKEWYETKDNLLWEKILAICSFGGCNSRDISGTETTWQQKFKYFCF